MLKNGQVLGLAENAINKYKVLNLFKSLFTHSYSYQNAIDMFMHGYHNRDTEISDLEEKCSRLEDKLNSYNGKINTQAKQINLAEKALVERAETVRDMKKAMADNKVNASKELGNALKECTDDFLKIIDKKEKEIEKLKNSMVSNGTELKQSKPKKAIVPGLPKLNCAEVKKLRAKYKTVPINQEVTILAKTYGVSNSTIKRLIKKETYKKCL